MRARRSRCRLRLVCELKGCLVFNRAICAENAHGGVRAGPARPVEKGETMIEETDREIEGAARIFERAMSWGHLPAAMTFEKFLAALRRGDDPYLGTGRGSNAGH